jgi:predicted nucleotidyltransferase
MSSTAFSEVLEATNACRALVDGLGKQNVAFALLTGSRAAGVHRADSDIDVLVVLAPTVDLHGGLELHSQFVERYLLMHQVLGARPDVEFPGELLLHRNLHDVLSGAAFTHSADGKCGLVSPDEPYRYWLSMFASGTPIAGRPLHLQTAAWEQMIAFADIQEAETDRDGEASNTSVQRLWGISALGSAGRRAYEAAKARSRRPNRRDGCCEHGRPPWSSTIEGALRGEARN